LSSARETKSSGRSWIGVDHGGVSDADQFARLVGVAYADVDVHILELRNLVALVVLEQMDRLARDHADDLTAARVQPDPLADQHARVPPAHLAEAEVTVLVDMRDVQADLVDVTDDCQTRTTRGPRHARIRRPDVVGPDLRELRAVLPPHARGRGFVAGRTGGGQQAGQKLHRHER